MKRVLFAVGLVLAVAVQGRADTIIGFESSEGYSLGNLGVQDNWTIVGGSFYVNATDASQGLWSVELTSTGGTVKRSTDDTYELGETVFASIDVKLGNSSAYMQLYDTLGATKLFEFGFDSSTGAGFYAHNSITGVVKASDTSMPEAGSWVTIWAKVYDNGSGDILADLGWSELDDTPFVDGLKLEGYNSLDYAVGQVRLAGRTGSRFDNLMVSTIPEPSVITLLGCGLIGLLAYAWRKRK